MTIATAAVTNATQALIPNSVPLIVANTATAAVSAVLTKPWAPPRSSAFTPSARSDSGAG